MNELKRAIAHNSPSGAGGFREGLDFNLSQGEGARIHYISLAVRGNAFTAGYTIEAGLTKHHYDYSYAPAGYGEIYSEESMLVSYHWGMVTSGLFNAIKRFDVRACDYVAAINMALVGYVSHATQVYCIVDYELIRLSSKQIAQIYNWQGGIE